MYLNNKRTLRGVKRKLDDVDGGDETDANEHQQRRQQINVMNQTSFVERDTLNTSGNDEENVENSSDSSPTPEAPLTIDTPKNGTDNVSQSSTTNECEDDDDEEDDEDDDEDDDESSEERDGNSPPSIPVAANNQPQSVVAFFPYQNGQNRTQTVNNTLTQPSMSYSYIRQKHLTFNISMCKLNRYRQSSDPSLLRSVLICNTLKRLEKELEREGIKINFGPNGVSFVPIFVNSQPPQPPSSDSSNSLQLQVSSTLITNSPLHNRSTATGSIQTPPVVTQQQPSPHQQSDASTIDVAFIPLATPISCNSLPHHIHHLDAKYKTLANELAADDTDVELESLDSVRIEPIITGVEENETERYLLDLNSTSGRVTPFIHRTSEGLTVGGNTTTCIFGKDSDQTIPVVASTAATSTPSAALWSIDESTDRLSSLNWSSVLNFDSNTSLNTSSLSSSDDESCARLDSSRISIDSGLEDSPSGSETSTLSRHDISVTVGVEHEDSSIGDSLDSIGIVGDKSETEDESHSHSTATSLHTLMPPVANGDTPTATQLINHHHQQQLHSHHHNHSLFQHLTNGSSPPSTFGNGNGVASDEIFGDIDLSLYDFDLISAPNVKLAPVNADELLQRPTVTSMTNLSSTEQLHQEIAEISASTNSVQLNQPASTLHCIQTSSNGNVAATPTSTCGSSIGNGGSFQTRFFKPKDKHFTDEMPTTVIS